VNDDRRGKIRTALTLILQASQIIQEVWIEEDAAYDGVPENLRGSTRGQQSQDAATCLYLRAKRPRNLKSILRRRLTPRRD
jgi:hypothetical protein